MSSRGLVRFMRRVRSNRSHWQAIEVLVVSQNKHALRALDGVSERMNTRLALLIIGLVDAALVKEDSRAATGG